VLKNVPYLFLKRKNILLSAGVPLLRWNYFISFWQNFLNFFSKPGCCKAILLGSLLSSVFSTIIYAQCPSQTFNVTGGGSYCAGGSGVTISLDGSESGMNYYLMDGLGNDVTSLAGTGTILDFNNITAADTYTIEARDAGNTCSRAMNGSAIVTILASTVITGDPLAAQTVCQNDPLTGLSVTATGDGTLTYQWLSNTTNK